MTEDNRVKLLELAFKIIQAYKESNLLTIVNIGNQYNELLNLIDDYDIDKIKNKINNLTRYSAFKDINDLNNLKIIAIPDGDYIKYDDIINLFNQKED